MFDDPYFTDEEAEELELIMHEFLRELNPESTLLPEND